MHLFGFYFYGYDGHYLHYGQRIVLVCFSSISVDSDYHNAVFMFMDSE